MGIAQFLLFICVVICHAISFVKTTPDSNLQAQDSCDINGRSCPPGLFCDNGTCKCGKYPPQAMTCNGTNVFALKSMCVTADTDSNILSVGYILCSKIDQPTLYRVLPTNAEELNNATCNNTQRTGVLCGECLPDHYPLAYSFSRVCIRCSNIRWNWFKYIIAAYIPLTIFYCIIVFFNINVTSSHLFASVYFCQMFAAPYYMRSILASFKGVDLPFVIAKIVLSFYGMWNLDFFRPFYNNLCLGIGVLPTIALDYTIALYPLLLIVITHLLMMLHDKNCRLVVRMWRPFQKMFSLLGRNFKVQTSLIDAYATLFFLSSMKFFLVSFDLLLPTVIHHVYPNDYNYTIGLHYEANVRYFGEEHVPYAILAISVACVFYIFPVALLVFYPFRWFQKCLNLFPFRWYILHTFMDSFQGCYKNGMGEDTHDYRWFSSTFFLFRMIHFLILGISPDIIVSLALVNLVVILFVVILATLQPFKATFTHHNVLAIVFLLFLATLSTAGLATQYSFFNAPKLATTFLVASVLFGNLPLLYAVAIICHWLYKHRRFRFQFAQRWRAWKNGYDRLRAHEDVIDNSHECPRENLCNIVQ